MVLRLAFAVQACTDPDILVVDEALAVGDIFFRQKCYKRMENLRSRGCTILLVTHAMDDVEQFCDRAILLELGTSLFQGSTVEAVKRYYLAQGSAHAMHIGHSKAKQTEGAGGGTQIAPASKMEWPTIAVQFDVLRLPQVSNGGARCVAVALTDASGVTTTYFEQGQAAVFWYEFELAQPLGVPMGGVTIHNEKGIIVHGKGTVEYGATVPTFVETGRRIRFKQTIVLSIAPGEYTFEVGMAMMPKELFEQRRRMSVEELYGSVTRVCHVPGLGILGVGLRAHYEQVRLLHHGIADLPGNCEVEVL
jgi:lipopolysaccharide transport system ATP-binding protein